MAFDSLHGAQIKEALALCDASTCSWGCAGCAYQAAVPGQQPEHSLRLAWTSTASCVRADDPAGAAGHEGAAARRDCQHRQRRRDGRALRAPLRRVRRHQGTRAGHARMADLCINLTSKGRAVGQLWSSWDKIQIFRHSAVHERMHAFMLVLALLDAAYACSGPVLIILMLSLGLLLMSGNADCQDRHR